MFRNYWLPAIGFGVALNFGVLAQEATVPPAERKPVPPSSEEKAPVTDKDTGRAERETSPDIVPKLQDIERAVRDLKIEEGGLTPDPTPTLQNIERAIRELKEEKTETEIQRQNDRETRNLDAQETIAYWAGRMFWATIATVLLTFGALITIIRTLRHTRRAADYAKDMATEAQAATEAATKAADQAEASNKILRAEQRPWLSIGAPVISSFSEPGIVRARREPDFLEYNFSISVKITNNGKFPARNVNIFCRTGDMRKPVKKSKSKTGYFIESRNGDILYFDPESIEIVEYYDRVAGKVAGVDNYVIGPNSSLEHQPVLSSIFKVPKKNADVEMNQSVLVIYVSYMGTENLPKLYRTYGVYGFYHDAGQIAGSLVTEYSLEKNRSVGLRQIDGEMD